MVLLRQFEPVSCLANHWRVRLGSGISGIAKTNMALSSERNPVPAPGDDRGDQCYWSVIVRVPPDTEYAQAPCPGCSVVTARYCPASEL